MMTMSFLMIMRVISYPIAMHWSPPHHVISIFIPIIIISITNNAGINVIQSALMINSLCTKNERKPEIKA